MTIFDNERIAVLNKPEGYSVQGGDDPNYNIFYTTANCVNVGIISNCAEAQNSWENLEKSETQKLA